MLINYTSACNLHTSSPKNVKDQMRRAEISIVIVFLNSFLHLSSYQRSSISYVLPNIYKRDSIRGANWGPLSNNISLITGAAVLLLCHFIGCPFGHRDALGSHAYMARISRYEVCCDVSHRHDCTESIYAHMSDK